MLKESFRAWYNERDRSKAEERLGVGSRKGDIKLYAIVTYVERIANLDNFTSVWEGTVSVVSPVISSVLLSSSLPSISSGGFSK